MKLEILKFLYDGKVILIVFTLIILSLSLIKDRQKFIKLHIVFNFTFLSIFLSALFLERIIEDPAIPVLDPRTAQKLFAISMERHFYKFLGLLIYFLINLIILYKKFVWVIPESLDKEE